VDKRRLRSKCGVAVLAKLLSTLVVAALFASGCALPFNLMLVYPRPDKAIFAAIDSRDPGEAYSAMRNHITFVIDFFSSLQ